MDIRSATFCCLARDRTLDGRTEYFPGSETDAPRAQKANIFTVFDVIIKKGSNPKPTEVQRAALQRVGQEDDWRPCWIRDRMQVPHTPGRKQLCCRLEDENKRAREWADREAKKEGWIEE